MSTKKMMECGECGEVKPLLSRYQDNEPTPLNREKITAHLQVCASCQKDFRELAAVTARVKRLQEVDTGPYFTARVMGKVLEKEKQRQSSPWWAWLPLPSARTLSRLVYASVFIVFLVLGVLVSNGSIIDLNNVPGKNQSREIAMINLLVESQDLGLINVQDKSLALLGNGNGEHNEE